MSRRRIVLVAVVVAVGAAAAVRAFERPGPTGAAAAPTATKTVPVQRTTLVQQESWTGTVEYGDERDVVGHAQGTISALPAEGATVDRNGVLYEVDGRNVRLFFGDRPAWRVFSVGMEAGPDVRQLEENLVALGHATKRALGVDEEFTDATTAAVKRWEKALGMDQDGVIALGEVVFLPGAVRVDAHTVPVGKPVQPGASVLTVTSVTRVVALSIDADDRSLVAVGDTVEVELPDGTRTGGTVASVGTPTTTTDGAPGGGDTSTVDVIVAVADQAAIEKLDGAGVEVHVTRSRAEDVLAVPVNALLALSEGGYAVEVTEASAGTRLVAVEVGLFARGLVEVRGEIDEGTRVVVPA